MLKYYFRRTELVKLKYTILKYQKNISQLIPQSEYYPVLWDKLCP